jgi:hypothetical protein
MTKIREKIKPKDVRLHIDKSYEIINKYLPNSYGKKVQEKLTARGIVKSNSMVRNVKNKLNYNSDIIEALVEVAVEAKEQNDKIKKLINKCKTNDNNPKNK